jgi:hypothetical protein|nr:MAG TPA: hypothetical protein [Caudoviricetes sp.]
METKDSKQPKIVNLCEDGNFHEHDEKSYNKIMEHQKENK